MREAGISGKDLDDRMDKAGKDISESVHQKETSSEKEQSYNLEL